MNTRKDKILKLLEENTERETGNQFTSVSTNSKVSRWLIQNACNPLTSATEILPKPQTNNNIMTDKLGKINPKKKLIALLN